MVACGLGIFDYYIIMIIKSLWVSSFFHAFVHLTRSSVDSGSGSPMAYIRYKLQHHNIKSSSTLPC